jgi:lipid-A-disaccharide synthase
MPTSVLLIAGEVSGDLHTALVARKLLERNPDWTLHALGGPNLRKAVADSPGSHFLGDTSNLSAIGIFSASLVYLRCRKLFYSALDFIRKNDVDAVVLCDWGGFNGRLLPHLHALGVRVLYYFTPRSWQRTGSAGLDIARYVTRVATPFRWSAERLTEVGCSAEWVGHPLVHATQQTDTRRALRAEFGIDGEQPLVALLPGSRSTEIRVLAPRLAEVAKRLNATRNLRFIAVVPETMQELTRSYLPEWVTILSDRARDVLHACDAAIVKMGTATLEAALVGAPQVAVYDLSIVQRIEWCLLWAWKRIPFIAMPNIILQREAVPELLGLKCTPQRIEQAITAVLEDEKVRLRMFHDYREICRALGSELPASATERTAEMIEEMVMEAETVGSRQAGNPGKMTREPLPITVTTP